MHRLKHIFGWLVTILAFSPLAVLAGTVTWPQDTNLAMSGSGITLVIRAGSTADALVINPSTFTVTVGAGDAFLLRYAGPNPGRFANNAGLPECTLVGSNNDLTVNGPLTVTFTPNATLCEASSGGGGGGGATLPSINLVTPAANASLQGGTTQRAMWTVNGSQVRSVRLRLSIDGVSQGIVAMQTNPLLGYVDWTVPTVTTSQAMLTAEALGPGGETLASDTNGPFSITFDAGPPPAGGGMIFIPSEATAASPTISIDKDLIGTGEACAMHELIKLPDDGDPTTQYDTTVYYCGIDGKRYVFPNVQTYNTWYSDFSGVRIIDAATMASFLIGGNVTFRPGVRMIKIQTDPKVYAVDHNGLLHWIPDEATAVRLYGPFWNTLVDDISDAFFVNYHVGVPVA